MGKRTVVVIDDEVLMRESIQVELVKHGLKVVTAEDGEACQTLILGMSEPCLFLVDLMMPNLDGWGLLDRIREHGQKAGVEHKIILCSGSTSIAAIARQEEVDFLAKPFRLQQLLEKIGPYLECN